MNHIIVYSHGFGVRADDRGLFTDIASALPKARHITFDYNTVNETTGNLTVHSLNAQSARLAEVLIGLYASEPNATIDIVAHSQGCVVVGLRHPIKVRKIVLTAPPADISVADMRRMFESRPGSRIKTYGQSRLVRSDGSITIVEKPYWRSIRNLDLIALYNALTDMSELTVVNAKRDEVIGSQDFSRLTKKAKRIELDADHNFGGPARAKLVEAVAREISD
jgi:pimeloyl-ACP methyl ester carboxylesterase